MMVCNVLDDKIIYHKFVFFGQSTMNLLLSNNLTLSGLEPVLMMIFIFF